MSEAGAEELDKTPSVVMGGLGDNVIPGASPVAVVAIRAISFPWIVRHRCCGLTRDRAVCISDSQS